MPIVVDAEKAAQGREVLAVDGYTRTTREEDNYFITMYTGAPPDTAPQSVRKPDDDKSLPQSYLVEQPAGSTIPAHFHDTNQFQVFIDGNAMFGKKPIGPLSVHFAGGHTPYGPILTQDEPAHFFTLRAHWEAGGKPMPECRDRLQRVKRVYRLAASIDTKTKTEPCNEVIPVEKNGLGTSLFRIGAGESATLDLSIAGGGQYALVLQGDVRFNTNQQDKLETDSGLLGTQSCVYRYPHESALTATAGPDGASVLLLQFPTHEALESIGA